MAQLERKIINGTDPRTGESKGCIVLKDDGSSEVILRDSYKIEPTQKFEPFVKRIDQVSIESRHYSSNSRDSYEAVKMNYLSPVAYDGIDAHGNLVYGYAVLSDNEEQQIKTTVEEENAFVNAIIYFASLDHEELV